MVRWSTSLSTVLRAGVPLGRYKKTIILTVDYATERLVSVVNLSFKDFSLSLSPILCVSPTPLVGAKGRIRVPEF